ncbi:MAG: hypothetical protein M1831_002962 [Alyxoria varia]|nr:MAG: hypothetical protein M1831_002962 [Alyxoria varia]
MVSLAESQGSYSAKEHLHPGDERQSFPYNPMSYDQPAADPAHKSTLDMQSQIYSQNHLGEEQPIQDWRKGGMNIVRELAALMLVSKEVANYCEYSRKRLNGDVPSGTDNLAGDQHLPTAGAVVGSDETRRDETTYSQ